jgi:serine/threonine protein phosphatase PrpC
MVKVHLDMAGGSDIGCARSENQDHFLVADLRRQLVIRETDIPADEHEELISCREGSLLVVADGMGGHFDGEKASRTAVKATARFVLDAMRWFLKLSAEDEQDFIDELATSLRVIQDRLWSQAGSTSRPMGTTVTMSYLLWPKMYVVHAGDSRCYLFRDGKLEQLTTDHTVAQQLLDAGGYSQSDAAISRWKHVLWNCVGGGEQRVRPEAVLSRLQIGDTVLLCSDGLTGMVDDSSIAKVLGAGASSSVTVAQLIDAAKSAGGNDNISVVVCKVLDKSQDQCEEGSVSANASSSTTVV